MPATNRCRSLTVVRAIRCEDCQTWFHAHHVKQHTVVSPVSHSAATSAHALTVFRTIQAVAFGTQIYCHMNTKHHFVFAHHFMLRWKEGY